jgi:hypothetical protein
MLTKFAMQFSSLFKMHMCIAWLLIVLNSGVTEVPCVCEWRDKAKKNKNWSTYDAVLVQVSGTLFSLLLEVL